METQRKAEKGSGWCALTLRRREEERGGECRDGGEWRGRDKKCASMRGRTMISSAEQIMRVVITMAPNMPIWACDETSPVSGSTMPLVFRRWVATFSDSAVT